MADRRRDDHEDIAVETESELQAERPRHYKVLLHNDDYTSMEFVVHVLMQIFRKDLYQATEIMLTVHQKGMGVAGVYSHEIAQTKVRSVLELATQAEYPLQCSMEPE